MDDLPFPFNPADYEPWVGDVTAKACALRLWLSLTTHSAEIDNPDEAIMRAEWDPEVWQALRKWAMAQNSLSDAWKVAMHDLWLHGCPPAVRKSQPMPTAYRDRVLRYIGEQLFYGYDLKPTQTRPGGPIECAASVLASLDKPGIPSEGTIANILSANTKSAD